MSHLVSLLLVLLPIKSSHVASIHTLVVHPWLILLQLLILLGLSKIKGV